MNWRLLKIPFPAFALVAVFAGCVSLPGPTKVESDLLPRPGAKVAIGAITNASREAFDVDATKMLRDAISASLSEEGIRSSDGDRDFILALQITEYRPGNAFKRWLLPGWGSTVLTVHGELRNIGDGKLAASIDHSRSVPAGGLFSIGAWKRIFTFVAEDIANDVKIHIERGKGFVVSLPPWADKTVAARPSAAPISTKIAAIKDGRPETKRIGERFAAFGVSMGDVYFSRKVPEFIYESLAAELGAMGQRIVDSGENLLVLGEVNKFWIHTETTPLYWDIIGEIQIKLSIRQADLRPVERDYACKTTDRTYVWPGSGLLGDVLGRCLADLMAKVRSDNAWSTKAFVRR